MSPLRNVYMVPSIGLSGDIVVVWRKELGRVNFTYNYLQVLFGHTTPQSGPTWILAIVYTNTIGAQC